MVTQRNSGGKYQLSIYLLLLVLFMVFNCEASLEVYLRATLSSIVSLVTFILVLLV